MRLIDSEGDVHITLNQGMTDCCPVEVAAEAVVAIGCDVDADVFPCQTIDQFDETVLQVTVDILFADLFGCEGAASGMDMGDRLVEVEDKNAGRGVD